MDASLFTSFLSEDISDVTFDSLWTQLLKNGVVRLSSNFGSSEMRSEVKTQLATSKDIGKVRDAYNATSIELSDIYHDKKDRSNQVFKACMISIALAFILLITGLTICFIKGFPDKIKIVTCASSLIPTFLGGTFFWLYKRTEERLAPIENDIKRLKVLEGLMSVAEKIPDEEVLKTAYKNIVKKF